VSDLDLAPEEGGTRGSKRKTLAPWVAGLILDGLDLATAGPVGIYGGFIVAFFVGWWLASQFGYKRGGRLLIAILSAVYIATPFTEIVPVATVLALLARLGVDEDPA
jgi:hypothetical protein